MAENIALILRRALLARMDHHQPPTRKRHSPMRKWVPDANLLSCIQKENTSPHQPVLVRKALISADAIHWRDLDPDSGEVFRNSKRGARGQDGIVVFPIVASDFTADESRRRLFSMGTRIVEGQEYVLFNDGSWRIPSDLQFVSDSVSSKADLSAMADKCTHFYFLLGTSNGPVESLITSDSLKSSLRMVP